MSSDLLGNLRADNLRYMSENTTLRDALQNMLTTTQGLMMAKDREIAILKKWLKDDHCYTDAQIAEVITRESR